MARLSPVKPAPATAGSPDPLPRAERAFTAAVTRAYGLDLRSLAAFRIALALCLLADLVWRARDLRAFYTDFGVLPRAALLDRFADPWQVSVHLMTGAAPVEAALFALAFGFALLLLVGYRTRLAAIASWFLLISLQNRNPVVLQGGDVLLRVLAFWAMFVPLNAHFSLDRALDPSPAEPPPRVCTAGTVGLLAQVAFLYWFTLLLKSAPEWWSQGTAVYYALSLEQFATPVGRFLLRFPDVLRALTYATVAIEGIVPVLLFSPWRSRICRTAAVLLLVALQAGLLICLHLGHFPWVALTAAIPLIPAWGWWGAWRRPGSSPRGVAAVYYDGGCGFCRRTVALLKAFVLAPHAPVLAAQDDPRVFEEMRREHSWIVVERSGARSYRAAALAAVLRASAWWPLALPLEHPWGRRAGEATYRWVAGHRPLLSRLFPPLQERPLALRSPRLAAALAAFFIAYIFWWNIGTVSARRAMPDAWRWIGMATRTDQRWDMFAPYPLRDDGWYVIDGVLHDGRHVDVFRDAAPVSFATPSAAAIAAQYKDERWRKYMMNLYLAAYSDYRLYYGRYLCRSWNQRRPLEDPGQLETFRVYFMMHTTVLWNQSPEPYRKILLYSHHCF